MRFSEEHSADVVAASFDGSGDPRLRRVIQSLVRHLHDFVKDVELMEAEWDQAVAFLTATGHKCDATCQEFVLLSDVLGVSVLMETINHRAGGATESTGAPLLPARAHPPRGACRRVPCGRHARVRGRQRVPRLGRCLRGEGRRGAVVPDRR